jgi:hypothetical protein
VMLFTVSFILVPGHLCRGADLGRQLATAALGGFRPHLPCGAASVRRVRACLSSSSVSPARRFA